MQLQSPYSGSTAYVFDCQPQKVQFRLMPVPVAVTHPKGKGIAAANATELQTEGPFARLAAKRAAAEETEQQATNGHTHDEAPVQNDQQQSRRSIVVNHLDFCYPGLGEYALPAVLVHSKLYFISHGTAANLRQSSCGSCTLYAADWITD